MTGAGMFPHPARKTWHLRSDSVPIKRQEISGDQDRTRGLRPVRV